MREEEEEETEREKKKYDRETERDQWGREIPLSTPLAENNITSFLQREEEHLLALRCSLAFSSHGQGASKWTGKSQCESPSGMTYSATLWRKVGLDTIIYFPEMKNYNIFTESKRKRKTFKCIEMNINLIRFQNCYTGKVYMLS